MNVEIDFNISEIHHVVKTTRYEKSEFLVKGINCYRLVYTINGKCIFILKNTSLVVGKDSILFFRPDEAYKRLIVCDDGWEFCTIGFIAGDDLPDFPNLLYSGGNPKLESNFLNANEVWENRYPGYKLHLKSILNKIFYTIISQNGQVMLTNRYIELTVRHMTKNLHKKITVAELADIAGYSPSYYNRVFIDTLGISPIKYLNHLRIERAKELLETGIFSSAEIAEKCGFENMYYFSNIFKKHTGTTPREYKSMKIRRQ